MLLRDANPIRMVHALLSRLTVFTLAFLSFACLLGQMDERVRAGVAVLGRVGQGADATRVEDDDERASTGDVSGARTGHAPRFYGRLIWARGCASKYTSRSRSADRCVYTWVVPISA